MAIVYNWQLWAITNTTQSNSILNLKKGIIFHIRCSQTGKFGQFYINRLYDGKIYLKCKKSSCKTHLYIQSPGIMVEEVETNHSKKNYKLHSTVTKVTLRDKDNYGDVFHIHGKCRDRNRDLCSSTQHDIGCETDKCQATSRLFTEVLVDQVEKSVISKKPSQILDTVQAIIDNNCDDFDQNKWRSMEAVGVNPVSLLTCIKHTKSRKKKINDIGPDNVPPELKIIEFADGQSVQFIYQFDRFTLLFLPSELRSLNNSKIFLDGTFKHCSNSDFSQIYIISRKHEIEDMYGVDKVKAIPVVFCIMKSKKEADYYLVFEKLIDIHDSLFPAEPSLRFKSVSTDFEVAVANVIQRLMPGVLTVLTVLIGKC